MLFLIFFVKKMIFIQTVRKIFSHKIYDMVDITDRQKTFSSEYFNFDVKIPLNFYFSFQSFSVNILNYLENELI